MAATAQDSTAPLNVPGEKKDEDEYESERWLGPGHCCAAAGALDRGGMGVQCVP